jgi:nucleotide-binding universal stress UspA family protein
MMQRFKNILFVRDEKTRNKAALERAVTLAKRNQAHLTVVAVIEELPRDMRALLTLKPPPEPPKYLIKEHQDRLEQLIAPIRREGIQVRATVLYGTPFLEIIREVLRARHDLVMMNAENAGGLKEMLFGGTTLHLIRKCPCPVWVMKPMRRKHYARILAAVDPTPFDEERNALNRKILDLATGLAQSERSELHIVHAWSVPNEAVLRGWRVRMPQRDVNELAREIREMHQGWLEELLQPYSLESLKHQVHLVKGDAGMLTAQLAAREQVELVVMGTVCRSGVAGLLIGNTAEKALRLVDCSVLTVKPDGFVTPVTLNE